ncbi:sigma 54 modulation/S30EA ribosomal C-terminal domain-containing protein [Actinoplanes sp. NPDC051861]|uniref:sigma 54 modulation/S30EA ribosomal C-terminal domain-containing protein n=1 Tax=Actinoplanes sp. NPDC051861 TaxID=3155170 RepID=UPI00344040DB
MPNRSSVAVAVRGAVTQDEAEHVRDAVGPEISALGHPVEQARVRLTRYGGRDLPMLVVAQVNVVVADRMVRSQLAASGADEAIDGAAAGLRWRLHRLGRRLAAERSGDILGLSPAGWRPVLLPSPPTGLLPVRERPRKLVRSKSCRLAVQDVDAAAFTMELRDYPFHLFSDDTTGAESVLYRGGPTGYRLLRTMAGPEPTGTSVPLTVRSWPAPVLPVAQAVETLNANPTRSFVFFTDPAIGRGRVLYRRYDGDLALLSPTW